MAGFKCGKNNRLINLIIIPLLLLMVSTQARACGLEDSDITWDNAAKTVSLSAGGENMLLQVGSLPPSLIYIC